MSNYPNLFVLLGPNVATGHTSAVAHIECQVNYLIEVIKPMTEARSPVRSLELTAKAENDYNVWLHNRLNQTVWQGGCQSYYRMANGKIIAMVSSGTWIPFALPYDIEKVSLICATCRSAVEHLLARLLETVARHLHLLLVEDSQA